MKRFDFLKKLGAITGTAIIAPSAFISKENTKFINSDSLNEPAKQLPRNYSKRLSILQTDAERKLSSLQLRDWQLSVTNMSTALHPDFFTVTGLPEIDFPRCLE